MTKGGTGYARTAVVAVLCALLALGSGLVADGASAAAGRVGAVEGFSNGKASSVAKVVSIAPGVGSLSLALTGGISVAQVTNDLAQAQTQTLDLGLIGSTLTGEQCDGSAPPLRQDQIPKPTTVDNRKGDATASGDELPIAGQPLGGGRQEADATVAPSAHATVSALGAAVGPVISISGGRSDASSRIVDGNAREAEATSSMDIDIAGVVQLQGLRWRAFHRTALDPSTDAATGSFEIASASALGQPLPVDRLQPLEDLINLVLAPSGIKVTLPRVQHITTPNDFVQVTPLTILLKDSPVGKTALGPLLNLTRTQREQLFSSIMGVYCKAAGALLVGDITLDVASGTGFLSTELGGATATTAAVDYSNPFGSIPAFTPSEAPAVPTAVLAASAPAAAPAVHKVTAPATPAALPAAATAPLVSVCESVHPHHRIACSKGLGLPLGVAGLGLVVGVGYLDWRRQRGFAAAAAAEAEVGA